MTALATLRRVVLRVLVPASLLALTACGAMPVKSPPPAARAEAPAATPAPAGKRSPYAPAQEDPSKRGDYVAGGLYAPGTRDSAPDELPDVDAIPEPEPKAEPRARYGNRDYAVLGKKYQVMARADGYVEEGLASYYGKKFHGRRTSSLEVYDMYAFSAAHKTLPLPSYARVTNLANGKSVVVRVNDRGPFHAGRIIDLSFAAAVKLGVHRAGVAKVEVRALRGPDDATGAPIVAAASAGNAMPAKPAGASSVTLQVASYSTREHAERGLARLHAAGIGAARLLEPLGQRFWRLRVGPLDLQAAEALAMRVAELGFGPPQRLRD